MLNQEELMKKGVLIPLDHVDMLNDLGFDMLPSYEVVIVALWKKIKEIEKKLNV